MKPVQDVAAGLYTDDSAATEIPRNQSGTAQIAVFTEPCRTSADLEARAKYIAENPIYPTFHSEDGTEQPAPLSTSERIAYASQFTPEEFAELQQLMR